MAKRRERIELDPNERLRDSPRQATSMSLPLAIYHRLDRLATATEDVGASRAEIIGMLLAEAQIEPEDLELSILRYRKMKVGDAIPDGEPGPERPLAGDSENVIYLERRGPGRPPRR